MPLADAALSLGVLLSGSACILADLRDRRSFVYLFKPLSLLLVIALALRGTGDPAYRSLVLAGLLFSLAGDVFLMLPRDRFLPGLASFLVAHLLYIAAFAGDAGLAAPLWPLLPLGVLAAAVYAGIRHGLGGLRPAVLFYMAAILAMAWQASGRALLLETPGAALACAGALLFTVSDGFLAWNRFAKPLPLAPALVLSSYFAAQWLIALSVGSAARVAAGG